MYILSFVFHSIFLCQLHARIYVCHYKCIGRRCVSENYILTMKTFIRSHSFISLPSFMFVSAVVSEIREWNQNKEKEKNFYFHLSRAYN